MSRTVEEVVRALSIELDKYDFTEEQVVLRIGVRAGIELAAEVALGDETQRRSVGRQQAAAALEALLKEPSDV